MSSTVGYVAILVSIGILASGITCRPEWLDDHNGFLKNFVNHEFLALLGVILAITLASIASIHLEFNKIEERYKKRGLSKSRSNLISNAYWLIGSFLFGVLVVVVKPIADTGSTSQAIFNSAALVVLLLHILILISLTQLIFAIEPDIN